MELVPLGPGFAAEVRGTSLLDVASSDAAYRAVRAAFEVHSVLLFRDQAIADDVQLGYSRAFGPLEITKMGSLGTGTLFVRLTNLAPDGALVPPTHRQALNARANQLWHTDSSFKRTPALASVLSARKLPASGGETEFASTRLAWQRLTPALKRRLKDAIVTHSYANSRNQIDPDMLPAEERASLPPVRWRLSWRNPANGLRALYIASHAYAIDGMGDNEAKALLAKLIEDATRPGLTYLHRWREGDVVMWDNRATMHRGRPWPAAEQVRSMVRTTISATDADGLAEVRPAA
ncbi:MAG TPA: TauD/TfdA family dioxygenase [Alphaproteobacteria bacterium]|nr:TauD/TfdA family dioxygenase [Alphaproteobacteria bacterium]